MTRRLIRSSLIIAGLCLTLGACDQAVEDEMTPSELPEMVVNEQAPVPIYIESLWDRTPTQIGTEIDSGALTIGGPALPVTEPTSQPPRAIVTEKTAPGQDSPLVHPATVGAATEGVADCVGVTCGATGDLQYDAEGIDDTPMHTPDAAPCMDEHCEGSAGLA